MAYKFSINYEKSISNLLTNLRCLAVEENASLIGDEEAGLFVANTNIGSFKGSYVIVENVITITLERKPFFLSNKIVEAHLRNYLS